MTDRDPIGICIEARARDLHAALADAVDGVPHWRGHAQQLLDEIEAKAQVAVRPYPFCDISRCPHWRGYCMRDPACNN